MRPLSVILPIAALTMSGLLSACASGSIAETGNDDWGQPVNGFQSRLSVNADVRMLNPGDLPQLRLEFRNQGKDPVMFLLSDVTLGTDLEIDGVWYANDTVAKDMPSSGYATVTPGTTSGGARLMSFRYRKSANDDGVVFHPEITRNLQPGKHTIRARVFVSLQSPPAKKFPVVSNQLTIEVKPQSTITQ